MSLPVQIRSDGRVLRITDTRSGESIAEVACAKFALQIDPEGGVSIQVEHWSPDELDTTPPPGAARRTECLD